MGYFEAWEFLHSNYIYLRRCIISIRNAVLHDKIKRIREIQAQLEERLPDLILRTIKYALYSLTHYITLYFHHLYNL